MLWLNFVDLQTVMLVLLSVVRRDQAIVVAAIGGLKNWRHHYYHERENHPECLLRQKLWPLWWSLDWMLKGMGREFVVLPRSLLLLITALFNIVLLLLRNMNI